jgi:hypothetical protein
MGLGLIYPKASRTQKAWRWRVQSWANVTTALALLAPFLRLKKPQAEIMLALADWRSKRSVGKVYSEQDLCHFAQAAHQLKQLKRGTDEQNRQQGLAGEGSAN